MKSNMLMIVQARMSSQRLPLKVLHQVNGKPLLQYLIESVQQCKSLGNIIVATSKEKSDDPIELFCSDQNVNCYRGELQNTASRFENILKMHNPDFFVRLCGDSPLLDYRIIDQAVAQFKNEGFDIVTNILKRSFPKGESVEVFKTETFLEGYTHFENEEDYEHVTKYFYRKHIQFNMKNFLLDQDFSDVRFSVDTPDDLNIFKDVLAGMERPHWQYSLKETLQIYNQLIVADI